MCGRAYQTYTDEELYFQYLNKRPLVPIQLTPVFNLCPTQDGPVLRLIDGERGFEPMRWQLVPNWEPDFSTKLSTINARSETVFESPLFGELVSRQRCIIPLSGFFEWKNEGGKRRPFKIHLQTNAIMSVAGMWEVWRPGTRFERRSFTILTTAANRFMREIHDRMPVILDSSIIDDWLSPETHEREELESFMKPCSDDWLSAAEISSLVNSPRNNSPEVLHPTAPEAAGRPQRSLFED
jgi:putative SOS response-associated peptidase YedK